MLRTIIWFLYFFLYLAVAAPIWLYCTHKVRRGQRAQVQPVIERVVHNWARPPYSSQIIRAISTSPSCSRRPAGRAR